MRSTLSFRKTIQVFRKQMFSLRTSHRCVSIFFLSVCVTGNWRRKKNLLRRNANLEFHSQQSCSFDFTIWYFYFFFPRWENRKLLILLSVYSDEEEHDRVESPSGGFQLFSELVSLRVSNFTFEATSPPVFPDSFAIAFPLIGFSVLSYRLSRLFSLEVFLLQPQLLPPLSLSLALTLCVITSFA